MAKNGYSFTQPRNVFFQEFQAMYGGHSITPSTTVSASANQAQIAVAVTDADCTQSSDLAGIYFAVQASYEKQLVTANQQALSTAVSQYRSAYKKELTKLAALLRTAKAQPFGPAARPAHSKNHAG
jgi:homoserine dehydrogenase